MADVRLLKVGSTGGFAQATDTDVLKIGSVEAAVGGIFGFDGTPVADQVQVGDAAHLLDFNSGDPQWVGDTGDALRFERSVNQWKVRVGGAEKAVIPDGLARSWVRFDGTGTPAINDSLNVASITDVGVGLYTVVLSTAMANALYAITSSIEDSTFSDVHAIGHSPVVAGSATGSFDVFVWGLTALVFADIDNLMVSVHGDV